MGCVDLLTNKPVPLGLNFNYGGCGPFTGTTCGLFVGQMGSIYDSAQKTDVLAGGWVKGRCALGVFVSNGLLIKPPYTCTGCPEWGGFFAVRSMPKRDARQRQRLVQGVASQGDTTAASSSDWPTHRSTAARSGSCAAVVPARAVLRWTCTPPPRQPRRQ